MARNSGDDLNNFENMSFKSLNIILIGQATCGKSTIIRTIIGDSTHPRGYVEPRDATFQTFHINYKPSNTCYRFNVIDTVGVSKPNINIAVNLNIDHEFLNIARICLKNNISSMNAICFVSAAGHTSTPDAEIFNTARRYLGPGMSQISMMILTHCNNYSDNTLQQFEQDIKREMPEIYEYCKLGVYFHGVYAESNENNADTNALLLQARMEKMTSRLVNCFIKLSEIECVIPSPICSIFERADAAYEHLIEQSMTKYHEENKRIIERQVQKQQNEQLRRVNLRNAKQKESQPEQLKLDFENHECTVM